MRERVFNLITGIMFVIFLCSAAGLDAPDPWAAFGMLVVSGVWLFYRAYDKYGFD